MHAADEHTCDAEAVCLAIVRHAELVWLLHLHQLGLSSMAAE